MYTQYFQINIYNIKSSSNLKSQNPFCTRISYENKTDCLRPIHELKPRLNLPYCPIYFSVVYSPHLSPPQGSLREKRRENGGKRERKGEIKKSGARGERWEQSPARFRFPSPQLPRALFPSLSIPQPTGKTKETSVEEREPTLTAAPDTAPWVSEAALARATVSYTYRPSSYNTGARFPLVNKRCHFSNNKIFTSRSPFNF